MKTWHDSILNRQEHRLLFHEMVVRLIFCKRNPRTDIRHLYNETVLYAIRHGIDLNPAGVEVGTFWTNYATAMAAHDLGHCVPRPATAMFSVLDRLVSWKRISNSLKVWELKKLHIFTSSENNLARKALRNFTNVLSSKHWVYISTYMWLGFLTFW